ncbi:ankyrin repeat domain-containing protein [Metallosphaera tengchongensis]|uniref:Ankyrin repeat domain-containing protein n=1 Tax=Metallosphaera tengchongensis TaxID=1532350 RepID=A0A6N0NYK9_9CREN|nr:ankyrin repeat domain-containing protein [Metallosphaera tengchongensis]QKR00893.1 ankyrin repeat domain-containing protein [Metallosphaera tengchongensis]
MVSSLCERLKKAVILGKVEVLKAQDKENLIRCEAMENLLSLACFVGEKEIVSYLLDVGVDPNRPDATGYYPIHRSFCADRFEILKLLVERGANPNVKDPQGFTVLHLASYRGLTEIVDFLISMGAVELKDSFGLRPSDYIKRGRGGGKCDR